MIEAAGVRKIVALWLISEEYFSPPRRMQPDPKLGKQRKPARGSGETILVIEDEGDVRKVLRLMLETRGYTVLVAESGLEGLEIFKQSKNIIRVIVTDMRMRGMQGPEVVKELRGIDPDARIIVVSGFRDGHKEVSEEPGRLIFLPKPMSGTELAAAIQSLLY